ncbi:MAG: DUF6226 family protein [Candidatus Microbacterium colombiense]|nr:MAG: DUF6226 family protein [Microbacterium sp.]
MTEDLFPAPAGPVPAAASATLSWPSPELPPPTRFVEGFERFASFLQQNGTDPTDLVGDVSALWSFLAAHPEVLSTPELAESASRFVGNVIAVVHPTATWSMAGELQVGTATRSIPVAGLVRIMVEQPEHREPFVEMLSTWDQADRDDQEMNDLAHLESHPTLSVPTAAFERPPFPDREYRDSDGQIIPYGNRWVDGPPPEEAYSRLSHPERFAPLLCDLDAVVAYLAAHYVVDVDRQTVGPETRVALRPSTGAPVTITATVESARITAGALFHTDAPQCSCDACDESAETVADQLEADLLAIAAGGLRERFPVGSRRWHFTQLCSLDGGYRTTSSEPDPARTPQQLEHAAQALRNLADGWWPAWTLRTTPS